MNLDERPSIDFERAKFIISDILRERQKPGMKTDQEQLGIILDKLSEFFSNVGDINTSDKDLPDKDSYARSDRFNSLMDSLIRDIAEIFLEQEQLENEITKTENVIQTGRDLVDTFNQVTKTKVLNSEITTVSNESKEYWSTDSFSSDAKVNFDIGKTDSRTMIDTKEGVLTLAVTNEKVTRISNAKWILNETESLLIHGNESDSFGKYGPKKLNAYQGKRYGVEKSIVTSGPFDPDEPWADNPKATIQSTESSVTESSFNDDLSSEYEIVIGELPRHAAVQVYIKRHIHKIFGGSLLPGVDWKLIRNKNQNHSAPYYMFDEPVNQVKMVADLNVIFNEPTTISKIYVYRNVNENRKSGPEMLTSLAVYGDDGSPLSDSSVNKTTETVTGKTFNTVIPGQKARIRVEKHTHNIEYFPYTVIIVPYVAKTSHNSVKVEYRKYEVEDASIPRQIFYRARDGKVVVEGQPTKVDK